MAEAGLGMAGGGQPDAVRADMLVHISGHRIGVRTLEHPTALTQQATIHQQALLSLLYVASVMPVGKRSRSWLPRFYVSLFLHASGRDKRLQKNGR
ncbi:hypothetical protein D3C76_1564550 [compost metagenome]